MWLFNKDGSGARRKTPENVFHEQDLYMIHGADGERDLVLEHGLSGLESEFAAIRDAKLAGREESTVREHLMLCAFMAAAQARTPAHRDSPPSRSPHPRCSSKKACRSAGRPMRREPPRPPAARQGVRADTRAAPAVPHLR